MVAGHLGGVGHPLRADLKPRIDEPVGASQFDLQPHDEVGVIPCRGQKFIVGHRLGVGPARQTPVLNLPPLGRAFPALQGSAVKNRYGMPGRGGCLRGVERERLGGNETGEKEFHRLDRQN